MKKRNILLGGAFALLGLCALASCGKKEDDKKEEATALSYAEYVAAADGDYVTIDGYVSGRCTWWGDAASFYLQDDDGGYYIYNLPCTQDQYNNDLKVGQKISVTGQKGSWSGEVEILGQPDGDEEATWEKLEGTKTYDPIALNSIEDMANHPNQLVKLQVQIASNGATVTGGEPTSGVDLLYNVKNPKTEDATQYTFYLESYNELSQYSTDPASIYQTVLNYKAGEVYEVVGYAYSYNGPQLHTISSTFISGLK